MAKSNNQKGKILYLERLLRDTGEARAVTMQEILAHLLENGIHAERKSIYDDLEVLRSFGMDIRYRRGKPGGYYVAGYTQGEAPASGEDNTSGENVKPEAEGFQRENPEADAFPHSENSDEMLLRQIRLTCQEEGRSLAARYFGAKADIREKPDGSYSVTVDVTEDSMLYGWLTAAGRSVRLVKPKKVIQNYREYLKSLAREYK